MLKFRIIPTDVTSKYPDLRKAYVTGMDRTPSRTTVELRPGLLTCHRETSESGRVHVPWPVSGFGEPVVSTATLAERGTVYDLAIELARGKLNDVQNQLADWRQAGLVVPEAVEDAIRRARKACARAATSRDSADDSATAAAVSLEASFAAAKQLAESYTDQLLNRRLEHSAPLPTILTCGLDGLTKASTWQARLPEVFHAGRVRMSWGAIAPDEGKRQWDESDHQVNWCRKNGLLVTAGPLIEFRKGALPDWLWLWDGDYDEIQTQAAEHVRQAVTRYRGKVTAWHLVHRVASQDILGLSEEEQIRLTAHLIQVAKRIDPDAQAIVDFDRPWGEWMASSRFQLGPLHLADSLARAELGLSGIGLEIAPGYRSLGSHVRDLLDYSRLLDLFALVNLPLHITLALPSGPSGETVGSATEPAPVCQWPRTPDEAFQRELVASWFALSVAKPYVRSVTWLQSYDSPSGLFPLAGLFRADGKPKPAFDWLKAFRSKISSVSRR